MFRVYIIHVESKFAYEKLEACALFHPSLYSRLHVTPSWTHGKLTYFKFGEISYAICTVASQRIKMEPKNNTGAIYSILTDIEGIKQMSVSLVDPEL